MRYYDLWKDYKQNSKHNKESKLWLEAGKKTTKKNQKKIKERKMWQNASEKEGRQILYWEKKQKSVPKSLEQGEKSI